jgi:transposase
VWGAVRAGLPRVLRHLDGLRLVDLTLGPDEIVLGVARRQTCARCPSCGARSRRVHSRYVRTVADQPIGGRRVTIRLHVRRLRCTRRECPRRTFAEQAPALAARSARRTVPLEAVLRDVALSLGGRPGARFAGRRGTAVSRMTLLRLVRALPEPAVAAPAVLGVDDFALARGRQYGAVVVDLARHRVVDLLPERTAEAFAAWLAAHGQPEIICRDRGGDFATGGRRGAPGAVQVADRWHLLRNVGDALERVLGRHRVALRAVVVDADPAATPSTATGANDARAEPPPPAAPPAEPPPEPDRSARYAEAVALRAEGWSVSAIGRRIGASRPTVRGWLRAERFPARARRGGMLDDLSPHAAHLRQRWAAGCRDAAELWRELRARGFGGSSVTVRRYVMAWRAYPYQRRTAGPGPAAGGHAPPPARARPPSPRQVRRWLLTSAAALEPAQRTYLERLVAACPPAAQARDLAVEFGRLLRTRDRPAFGPWLTAAATSGLPEFRELAGGMRRDLPAIEAALTHSWSSGQVEGQVTRIKLVKRQMFGRAGFDLLRRRVLLAG